MFANLQRDENIQDDGDFIGGNGPLDSNVYTCAIEMAYIDKSTGGAMSLNLHLKTPQGQSLRQTIYITSGNAKGNRNYYFVKKNGVETTEKRYLPGFNIANAICLLSIGKEISQLTPEQKTINLYNFELKKETPQQKDLLMELLGQEIDLGVLKQIVDKSSKNDAGAYVSTGETRTENEIDKVFRTRDGMTVAEITAQVTESTFRQKWIEKNKDQVRDKSTVAKSEGTGTTGMPGAAAPVAGAGSLFS
jgi:hypothetical protein